MVVLIRFAVDDTRPSVYQEALRALYFLVADEPDEKCLGLVQCSIPGGVQPLVSSSIYSNEKVVTYFQGSTLFWTKPVFVPRGFIHLV